MMIDTSSERSKAYLGTFNVNDEDMLEVNQIRKMVSNLNRDLKAFGYQYRYYVKLQGRGPRPSPRYWQSLPLSMAERVDAYIYRR